MYINLIRNFVLRSNYYSTNIDKYRIPTKIRTLQGKFVDIVQNRNNSLFRRESSYSIRFREDIKNLKKTYGIYCEFIQEFPIIIEDRDLWNNITNYLGISNKKFKDTNYFLLDFFFPYLGVIVEVDSEYHDTKKLYDTARDIYIKRMYGLDTVRFYKYGNNELERKAFIEKFKKVSTDFINYYKVWGISKECIFPLDFSKTMVDNFIRDNKLPLEFIDKLINWIGESKFIYSDFFTVSLKDIQNIDSGSFPKGSKFTNGSIEQMLLDNIIITLKKIYGKTLTVT